MSYRTYAHRTAVPLERSKAEVEKLLTNYGADQFVSGWADGQAMIAFRLKALHIKMVIPMPARKQGMSETKLAQLQRERWRAIVLIIKAKLEAVRSGVRTLEQEFLDDIVVPGGKTFGEWARPQIAAAYEKGQMPKQLPFLEDK
jgi:hypothetical protein